MHLCDLLTVPSQSAKNAPFETRRATLMRVDHFRIERPFLEPRRLGGAAPLLADPHREAADQVPLKDEGDDHGGGAPGEPTRPEGGGGQGGGRRGSRAPPPGWGRNPPSAAATTHSQARARPAR